MCTGRLIGGVGPISVQIGPVSLIKRGLIVRILIFDHHLQHKTPFSTVSGSKPSGSRNRIGKLRCGGSGGRMNVGRCIDTLLCSSTGHPIVWLNFEILCY